MIDLRAVTYRYPGEPAAVLDCVTWRVDGGFHLLRGESGSGKSTFLRTLNGLVPHFHGGEISGAIRVAGQNVLRTPTRRMAAHVGFVFQDPELQSVAATVERDVAFSLGNAGVEPALMRRRVEAALEQTGLHHYGARAVRTLSGGERQRLALAATLVTRPRVLVLDEPLAQLDDGAARAVLAICSELAATGTTIVMSEHRTDLAIDATTVTTLRAGEIVDDDAESDAQPLPTLAQPHAPGPPRWAFEGVTLSAGAIPLLSGVGASGAAGEVTTLMGANGSGKTTLLRALAGLATPTTGCIHRDGRVAYLPQNPGVLLHRETVRAEIEVALRRSGSAPADAARHLADFGLEGFAERFPRDLSTGQRQRVALAAILATHPDIALLDEPTRGMDAASRHALVAAISRLSAAGTSVVIATHDRNLVNALAATVLRVDAGSVREAGAALVHA